jgi:hypothetical protein
MGRFARMVKQAFRLPKVIDPGMMFMKQSLLYTSVISPVLHPVHYMRKVVTFLEFHFVATVFSNVRNNFISFLQCQVESL